MLRLRRVGGALLRLRHLDVEMRGVELPALGEVGSLVLCEVESQLSSFAEPSEWDVDGTLQAQPAWAVSPRASWVVGPVLPIVN